MRHSFKTLASLLLLTISLAFAATASAQSRELPYEDVTSMQAMLDKVDHDGVYSISYKLTPGKSRKTLPDNVQVEIVGAGKPVPVRIDKDHVVRLPFNQAFIQADARIRISQPKSAVGLTLIFKPRTPQGTRMRYSQLTESVPVMERGIEEKAGLMSFMAPEPYALMMQFPDATEEQWVVVTLIDGTLKRFAANADSQVELPWKPGWRDAQVQLSAPLIWVRPLLD